MSNQKFNKMKKHWILILAIAGIFAGLIIHFTGTPVFSSGDYVCDYFAFGDYSMGVFAAGKFSVGIFSMGIFSIGIFSLGIFNIGLYTLGFFLLGWHKKYPEFLTFKK